MGKYVLKRLGIALMTFFGITLLAYLLTSMMPGSPIDFIVSSNPNMTAEQVAALEEEMGINQPVVIQYVRWLGEFLRGNLGYSYRTGNPVFEEIIVKLGGDPAAGWGIHGAFPGRCDSSGDGCGAEAQFGV